MRARPSRRDLSQVAGAGYNAGMTSRVAVLASGSGSNLQSLLDHLHGNRQNTGDRAGAAEVVLVASNRADARALDRGRAAGAATAVLNDVDDGDALAALLDDHAVDLVVLAGYLKLVPASVVRRYPGRMLNVHPALLPSFGGPGMYGRRVHEAVLHSGARVSGVTVHFVDEEYDRGTIIAQWPVPVLPGDDAVTLAARVLSAEHILYPRVVEAVAAGRLSERGQRPPASSHSHLQPASSVHFSLTVEPAALAAGMDQLLSL